MESLIQKISSKKAIVGIIGLGYVGLPLALCYHDSGCKVIGFDIDNEKIDLLTSGKTYIKHISEKSIKNAVDSGMEVTSNFSRITEVDAIIICVPTPLNKYREPDLSFVIGTLESILPYIKKHQLLSLESTTYPGTTEEEIATRIQSRGFSIGEDFYIVYSPEREDPGNKQFNVSSIPKIIGGCTEKCQKVGIALYSTVITHVVPVSNTRTAEMVKLLENIHRSVNIGFINEMKVITDKMDIDIHEVVKAASSKPFGFTPYYPGPGVGGHCIPIDPFYLTWKAREFGMHTRFIELAGEINRSMQDYVVSKVIDGLNTQEKSLRGSKVLVLGIAYKKNVDDARESPPIFIMESLESKGAIIDYSDPYFDSFPKMREHHFVLDSVPLTKENLSRYDAVVLGTDHDDFDYDLIREHAKLIVDTRGKYLEKDAKIIKA